LRSKKEEKEEIKAITCKMTKDIIIT